MPETETKADLLEERADLRAQVAALTAQVHGMSLLLVEVHRDLATVRARLEAEKPGVAYYLIERMTATPYGQVAMGALLVLTLAMAMDVLVPGQSMAARVISAIPAAIHGEAGTQAPPAPEGHTDAP